MFENLISKSKYIDQVNQMINMLMPELSDSILVNILTINNVRLSSYLPYMFDEDWENSDKIEIENSNKILNKYMNKETITGLLKKYSGKSFIFQFSDIFADYVNSISGFGCRICSPIFLADANVSYVMAIFRLKNFYDAMDGVYYEPIEKIHIYIFVETLLHNILHNAQKEITSIEYPQIVRDISTHSVDYILCKNLTLPHQDIFIYLSSLYYEGSSVNAKIIRDIPFFNIKLIVELETPLTLNYENAHTIRKLMETSKNGCVLVLRGWEIVAITKEEYLQEFPLLSFEFMGHMHWKLCMSNKIIFRYKDGKYYTYDNRKSKTYFRQSIKESFDLDDLNIDKLIKIINIATEQKHGTSIIITDEAEIETKRLCDLERGIKLKEFNLNENMDIIIDLTSIDGAIILDTNCNCYGIGMILDGEAVCMGDSSRGSRYNSIVNYIEIKKRKKKKYIAFIISEDGMINVISSFKK